MKRKKYLRRGKKSHAKEKNLTETNVMEEKNIFQEVKISWKRKRLSWKRKSLWEREY